MKGLVTKLNVRYLDILKLFGIKVFLKFGFGSKNTFIGECLILRQKEKENYMCESCEILNINGHRTHEIGCPVAWHDYYKKCKWCGRNFQSENKHQDFCEQSCYNSYNGYCEQMMQIN